MEGQYFGKVIDWLAKASDDKEPDEDDKQVPAGARHSVHWGSPGDRKWVEAGDADSAHDVGQALHDRFEKLGAGGGVVAAHHGSDGAMDTHGFGPDDGKWVESGGKQVFVHKGA